MQSEEICENCKEREGERVYYGMVLCPRCFTEALESQLVDEG